MMVLTWNTTEGKYLLSFLGLHRGTSDGTIVGLNNVLLSATQTTHYQPSADTDHDSNQGTGNLNTIKNLKHRNIKVTRISRL